jgi:hypothetical protein
MAKQNTKDPLISIKIEKPIRNTDDFQASKIDLIEYCENFLFYIGAIGYMQNTYDISEKDILGARRSNKDMLKIKMFLCWLIKRNTTMQDTFLGRLMNLDRTSCFYLYNNFQSQFTQSTQETQNYWLDIEKEIYDTVNSHGKIKQIERPAIRRKISRSYQPNNATKKYIISNRKDIDYEFERKQFRDYYLSTGEIRSDWDSAFKFWCRRSEKMDKQIHKGRTSSRTANVVETNDQRLREYSDRHNLESLPKPTKAIKQS